MDASHVKNKETKIEKNIYQVELVNFWIKFLILKNKL